MKKAKNPVAKLLIGRQFQNKVIKDKTKYTRKQKHKGGKSIPAFDHAKCLFVAESKNFTIFAFNSGLLFFSRCDLTDTHLGKSA